MQKIARQSDLRPYDVSTDHSEETPSEDLARAYRLARQLPPKLLRQNLELLVELVERRGSGSLKVEKSDTGKVHMRGHGNEFGYSKYQL